MKNNLKKIREELRNKSQVMEVGHTIHYVLSVDIVDDQLKAFEAELKDDSYEEANRINELACSELPSEARWYCPWKSDRECAKCLRFKRKQLVTRANCCNGW